jgi:hypothetical protein
MKLLRHGPAGQERPGLLDADGQVRDLSGRIPDIAGEVLLPPSLADHDVPDHARRFGSHAGLTGSSLARMGVLVQPPPTAGAHRLHPARRG